jgi:chromosome segregation ATPase
MDGGLDVQGSGDAPVQGSTQGGKHIKSAPETGVQCPPGQVPPENLQKYRVQKETFEKNKLNTRKKVAKLKIQIADIENSRLSIRQMLVSTAKAAVTVVVAGTLLASVASPLLTGLVLGAIAFVVVDYLLYQNYCSMNAQIKILAHLKRAKYALCKATKKLAAAYSNLFCMEVKVTEQEKLITAQGQTVAGQKTQLLKQKTQISTLKQTNVKLEQNLQAVQQARADAEKKVKEITDTAKTLKESLEEAQTHMQALEERARELESENKVQAEELYKQAEAMKAFVDGQQKMVQELQTVLVKNESHFESMMRLTEECCNDVSRQLETIKNYVKENFEAVQRDLNAAVAALKEMNVGASGNQHDAKAITQAQEKVTNAIIASVAKLGTMQAYIIASLTAAQEELSKYVKEMETKAAQAHEALTESDSKFMAMSRKACQMRKRIEDVERQKERADAYLKHIQNSATGNQRQFLGLMRSPLENAQADADRIKRKLENLREQLEDLQTQLDEAGKQVRKAREASKAIEEENKRIASSCEELQKQNASLVESNNKLYNYIQSTRKNIQDVGESVDRASRDIDAAAENVPNVTVSSRWGLFVGRALGAGGTAAAASVFGCGAATIGAAAAVGVVAPMAVVFAAACVGKAAFGVLTKRIMGAS